MVNQQPGSISEECWQAHQKSHQSKLFELARQLWSTDHKAHGDHGTNADDQHTSSAISSLEAIGFNALSPHAMASSTSKELSEQRIIQICRQVSVAQGRISIFLPAAFNEMESEPPLDRDFKRLSIRTAQTVANVDRKNRAGQRARGWRRLLSKPSVISRAKGRLLQ